MGFLRNFIFGKGKQEPDFLDAEYEPLREKLNGAGLDETALRNMEPDERVQALETARLDPYDYIYLAC